MFLVFSLSGVAVLNLSSFTAMENQDAVQSLKNQYAVESAVNVAMWKINTVGDDFGSYDDGYVSVSMDTTTDELVASIDRYNKSYEIAMDLSEDHHFNRGIAAVDSIELNGHDAGISESNRQRKFRFLPEADLQYYIDNAVATHSQNFHTFSDDTLANGIHVFTGSFISLESIKVQGTLVFTGRFVWFLGGNEIEAMADENGSHPALVFTHSSQITMLGDEEVKGPIYAKNKIRITSGAKLSGPIVGNVVELNADINLLDEENPQYYKWNSGFGNYSSYSWPKHIGRWRVTSSEA
jgi:hypothetical protein